MCLLNIHDDADWWWLMIYILLFMKFENYQINKSLKHLNKIINRYSIQYYNKIFFLVTYI